MYQPSEEEREYLRNYRPGDYERPSVTVDNVIFTLSDKHELSILLIQRRNFPYKGLWAIPGGFVEMTESLLEAAARELKEETGLENIPMDQLATFGDVGRDPRMRVISVAYMAFVPKDSLNIHAGDDARDAELFRIYRNEEGLVLIGTRHVVKEDELAFDHAKVIETAIQRLKNRIDYTEDAFHFLENDQSFTIYELKKIFETVKGENLDAGNFRRDFLKKYVDTGKVVETGEKTSANGRRAVTLYRKVRQ